MMEGLVRWLLRRFRGKRVVLAEGIPAAMVLRHLLRKGAWPWLRGLMVWPLLGECGGNFFLGRGCRILSHSKLRVGRNVYVGDHAHLDCLSLEGVELGDNVTLREGCWLQVTSRYDNPGVGVRIGQGTYIGPRAVIGAAARIVIGERCQIGANLSLAAENHRFDGPGEIFEQGVRREGITIGDDVWIGNGVTILDGVTVGEGSVLGAGTVLTHSVAPRSLVAGVPGRVLRTR